MTSDLHREARDLLDEWGDEGHSGRIIRDLLAEVEDTERELASAADMILRASKIAGDAERERDEARATLDRVRAIAEEWRDDPCMCGYRIPDGMDSDSRCLRCASENLRRALDQEARRDQ